MMMMLQNEDKQNLAVFVAARHKKLAASNVATLA
jgi:hypothetical protein